MSNNAKSVKSVRKTDLVSQKTPFVAFKTFTFAHEAAAGDTVISLSALTTPTSYTSRGFVQPSASDLSSANLLLYRRNLKLQSTLRGVLLEYDAYDITGSLTIRLNFPAEAGEIFVGSISDVAKTGLQVIDGQTLVSTGTLAAGSSDYVVGQSFALNKYSSKQVGDVLVYLDGQLMFRNVGNATTSVSADGNYEEISAGQGLSNMIRFNIVDPVNARPVTVLSNGMLAERPEGSLRAEIETLAGQNDSIIETLAVVAGVPTTNFRSAPNSVDLQTFGQRVVTMESNRARIDQTNNFSAYQNIPGRTDGVIPVSPNVGERITGTGFTPALVNAARVKGAEINLTAGNWLVFMSLGTSTSTSITGTRSYAEIASAPGGVTVYCRQDGPTMPTSVADITYPLVGYVSLPASATIYGNVVAAFSSGSGIVNSSFIYAIRMP